MKRSITLSTLLLFAFFAHSQASWTMKANYAGAPNNVTLSSCVAFAIDSVIYAYNGDTANNFSAWNPVTNTWTPKADFPGIRMTTYRYRCNATGFGIGHYGYVGTGWNNLETAGYVDFWQYDPSSNSWTRKADYPVNSVNAAFGFSIGDTGYIAGGADQSYSENNRTNYAYIPATNTWIAKANIPLTAPTYGYAAVLNGKAYCGIGRELTEDGFSTFSNQFYEYNPTTDTWTQKTAYTGSNNSNGFGNLPRGFAVGQYVYVVNPLNLYKLFRYSPATNTWDSSTLASYPAAQSLNYFGTTLLGKGYFCGNSSLNSNFWALDPAQYFNITSYSPTTVCQGSTVTVNYSSNIPFNSTHTFSLAISHLQGYNPSIFTSGTYNCSNFLPGNDSSGTFTFTIAPGTQDLGIGQLLLIDSNANPGTTGATARSLINIHILQGITPPALPSSSAICNGHSQTLNGQSTTSGCKYYWATNAGVFDSTTSITVSPSVTTAYYLEISATDGCTLNDTTQVVINGIVNPNLPDTSYSVCGGTSTAIGGTPVANCTYSWTDNNGFTSNQVSPTVSDSVTNVYHLTINDTLTGCTGNASVTLNAKQSPAQTLCLVTVDSATGLNQIVWEKLDKGASASFNIYREVSTNNYALIMTGNQNSLSAVEDTSANPAAASYRYKISVTDTCGNNSVLSSYHNTIYLEYIGNGQLRWNEYMIENQTTPVATYDVLVDTSGTGNWQLLISVPGTQSAAADVNYNAHPHARYLLQANMSITCTPGRSINSSFSNIAIALPTGIAETANSSMISIYPNPATGLLTVQSVLVNQQSAPVVCDLTGQQMLAPYTVNGNKLVIDVTGLAAGMYWVKINAEGRQLAKKFAKVN